MTEFLTDFKTQRLIWDRAHGRIDRVIRASEGDSNGRILHVQIIDENAVVNTSGASLSLAWSTLDQSHYGLDAFQSVNAAHGKYQIPYTTGMLSNPGRLVASLVLITADSRIESDPFVITVTPQTVPDDAVESTNSFTALTQALMQVQDGDGATVDLSQVYNDIADLEQGVANLQTGLSNTNSAVTSIETDVADLDESLTLTNQSLANAVSALNTLQNTVGDLEQLVTQLETGVLTNADEINLIKDMLGSSSTENISELLDAKADLDYVNTELDKKAAIVYVDERFDNFDPGTGGGGEDTPMQAPYSAIAKRIYRKETTLIECWGDSTYATGEPGAELQKTLRSYFNTTAVTVTNKGLNGDGTNQRRPLWANDMANSNADVVFFNYCINDAKGSANQTFNLKISGEEYQDNLHYMVKVARDHGKIVIFDTPNATSYHQTLSYNVPEQVKQFANIMRQVAQELNVPFVDNQKFTDEWLTKPRNRIQDLLPDGYHPSSMGYKIKGRNMASIFIYPEQIRFNQPMMVPGASAAIKIDGTNRRFVSFPRSRSGYACTVDGDQGSIRFPVFIERGGMDLYFASALWENGSTDVELIYDGEVVSNMNLYSANAGGGNTRIDQELLVVENADPGFHLVEMRSKASGSITIMYLMTRPTRKLDVYSQSVGGSAEITTKQVQLQDVEIEMNGASRSLALMDIPTSNTIKPLDVTVHANFDERQGFTVFGFYPSSNDANAGLYVFLDYGGRLRLSEGLAWNGWGNAQSWNDIDLSNEMHKYRIIVSQSGVVSVYVDDELIADDYQLSQNTRGGFFGLLDILGNRRLSIDRVLIG